MPGDIVLGTGLSFASKDAAPGAPLWGRLNDTRTRLLSVRGPQTLSQIQKHTGRKDIRPQYGDLGLTASLLIWPDLLPSSNPKHAVCVVPHATDTILKKEAASHKDPSVTVFSISPSEPKVLALALMDCQFVVSSSLHVLMTAETFGIPARWYNGPDSNAVEKYLDYYEGIGANRTNASARTLNDAIQMVPMASPVSLDTMLDVTTRLIQMFPFEELCQTGSK
uniref:Polysaccharide pyruvyl transferase domain-containing protein n=1 Tax=Grammatophora oceanica TaxID=210454 RepID=A0A7S1VKR5_9STRA